MPPGLEANLEYLAIKHADFGAVRDSWIKPCPDDPSKVKVVVNRQSDKLDEMAWKGFTSANFHEFK